MKFLTSCVKKVQLTMKPFLLLAALRVAADSNGGTSGLPSDRCCLQCLSWRLAYFSISQCCVGKNPAYLSILLNRVTTKLCRNMVLPHFMSALACVTQGSPSHSTDILGRHQVLVSGCCTFFFFSRGNKGSFGHPKCAGNEANG